MLVNNAKQILILRYMMKSKMKQEITYIEIKIPLGDMQVRMLKMRWDILMMI